MKSKILTRRFCVVSSWLQPPTLCSLTPPSAPLRPRHGFPTLRCTRLLQGSYKSQALCVPGTSCLKHFLSLLLPSLFHFQTDPLSFRVQASLTLPLPPTVPVMTLRSSPAGTFMIFVHYLASAQLYKLDLSTALLPMAGTVPGTEQDS